LIDFAQPKRLVTNDLLKLMPLIGRETRRPSSDGFDCIAQDNAKKEECDQRTCVNQEQFLPLVPLFLRFNHHREPIVTPDQSPLLLTLGHYASTV
jgi:hypothetical protein